MSGLKAVERVVARMYKQRLRDTGRLPKASETRDMAKKVRCAAERVGTREKKK